MNSQGCI